MAKKARILAVDDSPEGLYALEAALALSDYEVVTASSGEEALLQAKTHSPDLVILDVNMPAPDGYEVTRRMRADPELKYTSIVLLTAKSELEDIVFGLNQGADDYITKPYAKDELLARVAAALRVRKLYRELQHSEGERARMQLRLEERSGYANIVGGSAAMRRVFDLIEKVKDAEVPVLITGESGTGKELVAAALHFQSVRKTKPFVVQNCAALHEQLLESELFGHVRGAFTGAIRDKAGLFEAANGGTLFLDEVGEMSPQLQAKLLRVLQDGSFTPVGSTTPRKVEVRVVAATHRNLAAMVAAGSFRQDLFYRLNVIALELPALRDRREDILALAEHFLRVRTAKVGVTKSLSKVAADALGRYGWPGNVRELQSEIERGWLLSAAEPVIDLLHLSPNIAGGGVASQPGAKVASGDLKTAIGELERRMIARALQESAGNKSEAARVLGISRSNLIAKVQEYRLEGQES